MNPAGTSRLPDGFTVRLRSDTQRVEDGRVLVGGSPFGAVRLSPRALQLIEDGSLTVAGPAGAALAARLLDRNLADPVLDHAVEPASLTAVIPVKDRAVQLDRALAHLRGVSVIVVDDGSDDPDAVARVAARHGADLLRLPANVGPAGARNAGLARVSTEFVAFVDSDVRVSAGTLCRLARHFADPRVGLVGPSIVGVPQGSPRWFERYDAAASSLAVGSRPSSVAPGSEVGWLPGACLVGRTASLRPGFRQDMRSGEDVDLVWRLLEDGVVVRFDPTESAEHDIRSTVRDWLGRKVLYGTSAAPLARAHGDKVAPAVLSPAMTVAGLSVLLRSRWALVLVPAVTTWTVATLRSSVSGPVAARAAVTGVGWAVRQEASLLLRHWWPATAALLPVSRTVRRMTVTALAVDAIVFLTQHRDLDPVTGFLARRLDDGAYGLGVWKGVVKHREVRALRIRVPRARRP